MALLLTQEHLAERAGISVRTVRDLEAGKSQPRASTRKLLLAVLGVAAEEQAVQAPALVPAQLPPDVRGFTGRDAEVRALDHLLSEAGREPLALVISAVSGTAGVGKTALAVHWAGRAAERFPDGQLFMDLRGYGPDDPVRASAALEVFLLDLGVRGPDVPHGVEQRMALYRSLMADRRMLVVLDNASSADQVRPLLPGSGSCFVVVTSRDSLSGLVARDGARRLDLDLLPGPDALRLLRALVDERVDAEPDAAHDIVQRCARLPLALRITAELAAARPSTTLRALADELEDEQHRLNLLDAGNDPRTAVSGVFHWSYRHLPPGAARAFRLLGLHPGRQWDVHSVAALIDADAAPTEPVLAALVRAHLVAPVGRPGRYGMHDLLHAYAASLAAQEDSEVERRAALTRLFDGYLAATAACTDVLFPEERERPHVRRVAAVVRPADAGEARAWLDTERPNLVAVACHPASRSWSRHAVGLSQLLWRYLDRGAHSREATAVHGCALAAARAAGDAAAEAGALRRLAAIAWHLGHFDEALQHSREALVLIRELGDRRGEGRALNVIAATYHLLGRYDEAIVQYAAARVIAVETGDRDTQALTSNNLGDTFLRMGRYQEAIEHLEESLAIHRATGDRAGQGATLGNLGEAHRAAGRLTEARESLDRALDIAREAGARNAEAHALNGLGLLLQSEGRHGEASRLHQRALDTSRDSGNQPVETIALNGLAGAALGDGDVHLALALHESALRLATDIGDRYEQARALEGLARALEAAGQPAEGRWRWQDALTRYDDLGVPEAETVRRRLAAPAPAAS